MLPQWVSIKWERARVGAQPADHRQPTKETMTKELWRPIPGFANYEASDQGRIRNLKGTVLNGTFNDSGYRIVRLVRTGQKGKAMQKDLKVSRAVLMAFVGPAPEGKPFAMHGPNGVKDNSLANLRWGSQG